MAEKQKVLIVDDDANIAELISLYLTKECYETKIVLDGEEALRVFPAFRPNIVLLVIRSAVSCAPLPRCPSSCSPPRARSSTRSWDWSWERTTT